MITFNSIGLGRTIGAGVNLLQTSDFQLSVVTSGGGVTIILPSISSILQARSGSGNLSLIQFIISDISGLAGTNNITLIAASGEIINGFASITLSINNISAILTPTSNNSWSLLASIIAPSGDTIGIAEVPVTFVNTGANYVARFGDVNVISGNPADFSKTNGSTTTSDSLFCTKEIIQCYASYYFQCITQTGGQRLFASLHGGARSAGGGISFPTGQNNARMSHQVNLGYVGANQPITTTLGWNGLGALTNNSSKLIINYKK